MREQKQFFILTNPINLPFTCLSYFVTTGMKDDIKYSCRGVSHLSEHIIVEELIKSHPELCQRNLINAYVDKEFTCFHSTSLCEDINDVLLSFGNMFEFIKSGLSNEIIQAQKNIIYNVENERVLSNPQLLNILSIEQIAFNNNLRIPTIVDCSFNLLSENEIRHYVDKEYLSASHFLVISGKIPSRKIIKTYFSPIICSIIDKKLECGNSDNVSTVPISADKLDEISDARHTVAVAIKCLHTSREYFSLNILCLFYKVCINNTLKETDFFLKDVSFKLYSENTLLFLTYNDCYDETVTILNEINIKDCSELFENFKKHFLFGYLQKSCDLLSFNKEIFKSIYYLNENLNFTNMKFKIDQVEFDDVIILHNAILSGNYISLPEDYYGQLT